MRVRSVVLAMLFACGLSLAAGKPANVHKHAANTPKAETHFTSNKAVSHKGAKVQKHAVNSPKVAKHKTNKYKKHKA